MKYLIFIFLLVLCYIIQIYGNSVDINILTYDYGDAYYQKKLESDFNEHAINNNLNITVRIEVLKLEQIKDVYTYFNSIVELFLKKYSLKNESPYDLYLYDSRYTYLYGPYLLDLNENLPKELIETYDTRILKEACSYKDKLVGLPTSVIFDILYSNN